MPAIQAHGTGSEPAQKAIEIYRITLAGPTVSVSTSLGELWIPFVLNPGSKPKTLSLLGSGDGLGLDVVLAELRPPPVDPDGLRRDSDDLIDPSL